MRTPCLALASLAVVSLSVAGCGSGATSGATKAGGTVTYHGQPLSGVNVTFTPEQGPCATGATDSAGRFSLMTIRPGDGAVAGKHKVTLSPGGGQVPPMPGTPEAAQAAAAATPFPAKYSSPATSGLTLEVKAGEANDFKIELTD